MYDKASLKVILVAPCCIQRKHSNHVHLETHSPKTIKKKKRQLKSSTKLICPKNINTTAIHIRLCFHCFPKKMINLPLLNLLVNATEHAETFPGYVSSSLRETFSERMRLLKFRVRFRPTCTATVTNRWANSISCLNNFQNIFLCHNIYTWLRESTL